ncbi:MAG TPA: 2Fe-2S iron-sulfur cluster-binding protein, partial [Halobacteriales archaeon]|nr:2Fe-2S iron-sulfur cluster-binding protein [Halobacteriales archaeon]
QQVLEQRAATVPEIDFPEPANRAIGAGGGAAAAVAGGAEGELEEGGAEAEEEAGPSSIPDDEAESFEIEFVKEGATIEVAENETILEAGEDEGWDLPYACREGQCLSCAAHIPDGASEEFVSHWHNQMLGEEELGEGYTLTCVAYPKADFSIETRESP